MAMWGFNGRGANERLQRVSETCFRKCVRRYEPDGEISVGEGACIDRCVRKRDDFFFYLLSFFVDFGYEW